MEIVPDSVAIGYVHPHTVTEAWANSLAKACLWQGNNIISLIASQNPRQESARNATIEKFLEGVPDGGDNVCAEWLMWIDTDQVFEMDAIERLRHRAKEYDAKAAGGITWIYQRGTQHMTTNGFLWQNTNFEVIDDYKTGGVYDIQGTGSAFVLLHRDMFTHKDKFWHKSHEKHPATGHYMGHDLAFFYDTIVNGPHRLIWDTGIQAGHIKHFTLDEKSFRGYQQTQK